MADRDPVFTLIDCNSYASCERVFRPGLAKTPISALINNDGCLTNDARLLNKAAVEAVNRLFGLASNTVRLR